MPIIFSYRSLLVSCIFDVSSARVTAIFGCFAHPTSYFFHPISFFMFDISGNFIFFIAKSFKYSFIISSCYFVLICCHLSDYVHYTSPHIVPRRLLIIQIDFRFLV